MKSREPGLDLIRCMGLLFVTGVHSFLYNGFYSEPQTGAIMWATDSCFWLFYTCNGIFMTLTGYLKCEKPLNWGYYRSLLPILLSYVLTCLISFPIRQFILGEKLTLFQWLEKMVTFGNYGWYVEMYIGLILVSPVINLALKELTSRSQLLWLSGVMLILSALPSITPLNLIPDYWSSLYPLTYYTLGAVIHRLQPKLKPSMCFLGTAVTVMLTALITVLSTDDTFTTGFGQGYGGFWTTLTVVFLFLGLYRIRIPRKAATALSWMAGGVFEGYILSRLFDVWIYNLVPAWHTPQMYPVIFVCITIPVFFLSILAGKLVHRFSHVICKIIPAPADQATGVPR